MRRSPFAVLALLVVLLGCGTVEPAGPARDVVLEHADPTSVADSMRITYEGCEVAAEGRRLSLRKGTSRADLDELEAYARVCDQHASRFDARAIAPGVRTLHEVLAPFARVRGLSLVVEAQAADAKLDVVAFDRAAAPDEAWAATRRLLAMRGVKVEEKSRSLYAVPAGIMVTDTTPSAVVLLTKNPRAGRALLELDQDVIVPEGQPVSGELRTLGAAAQGRVLLLGDKAVVTSAVATLRALDALAWDADSVFFAIPFEGNPGARKTLATVLEEKHGARVVAGDGRRLGILVARDREREARALVQGKS